MSTDEFHSLKIGDMVESICNGAIGHVSRISGECCGTYFVSVHDYGMIEPTYTDDLSRPYLSCREIERFPRPKKDAVEQSPKPEIRRKCDEMYSQICLVSDNKLSFHAI